uniref:Uncharacterized protein n=1 Tax=Panagrolaimus davidi TaxID=227884 RepID=A0A914Q231_9BILA
MEYTGSQDIFDLSESYIAKQENVMQEISEKLNLLTFENRQISAQEIVDENASEEEEETAKEISQRLSQVVSEDVFNK